MQFLRFVYARGTEVTQRRVNPRIVLIHGIVNNSHVSVTLFLPLCISPTCDARKPAADRCRINYDDKSFNPALTSRVSPLELLRRRAKSKLSTN